MNKYLLTIYFIMAPFYFFSSGLPQIAEVILCIAFLLNIPGIFKAALSKVSVLYSPLFLWMILVNVYYYYISQDLEFLTFSAYYLFNWLVISLVFFYLTLDQKGVYKSIIWGGVISGGIQLIISFFYSSPGYRESLFFNNPNQLAYFSLLLVITVLFCNDKLKGSPLINYSIMVIGLYLIFISASMGGLASLIVVILGYSILRNKNLLDRMISVSIGLFSLLIGYLIFANVSFLYGINNKLDAAMIRIHSTTNTSDFYLERGYNRIIENPEFLVLGAGEGQFERFNATLELHSSIGTILFSYGIVGLLLLILPFTFIFVKSNIKTIILLSAPILYGLSHNGLRDSMFWIFFILILHVAYENYKKEKEI
ncbi:hypothetical protein ACBR55_03905 [Salinicoccus roseus]|uniref:hypothetical protein n=1 Tax=Salinicoccus roseus TaxID=45670 RepID=UPI003523CA1B